MPNDNAGDTGVDIIEEDVSEVILPTAKEGESIDWEAEAKKFQGIATRRGTKLNKLKTGKKPPEEIPANGTQAPKPGEFDYGQKAFLVSSGIKTETELAIVRQAVIDTGRTLEAVLASPYVQGELTRVREEAATEGAVPSNEGRPGNPARDSVEYWLNKGELPPADQVELRRKVVNAKIAKQKGGAGVFTTQPVVGNK